MKFLSVLILIVCQLGCISRLSLDLPSKRARDQVSYELLQLKLKAMDEDLNQFRLLRADIRKILIEQKVILEVEALPFVESLYRNKRGVANAGIWNFDMQTALLYRLTINQNTDERNDILKSTRAVARYLRVLYEQLGDWSLAIIAYHHGPSPVMEMKQKNAQLTPWEAELKLNPNNLYWSRFVAAVQLIEALH